MLFKNISHIAEIKRNANADDFLVNFDQKINLPRPFEILSRLIIICGVPLPSKNRGLSALNLMKHISPLISDLIVELWDNVVPKLITNLEGSIKKAFFFIFLFWKIKFVLSLFFL